MVGSGSAVQLYAASAARRLARFTFRATSDSVRVADCPLCAAVSPRPFSAPRPLSALSGNASSGSSAPRADSVSGLSGFASRSASASRSSFSARDFSASVGSFPYSPRLTNARSLSFRETPHNRAKKSRRHASAENDNSYAHVSVLWRGNQAAKPRLPAR